MPALNLIPTILGSMRLSFTATTTTTTSVISTQIWAKQSIQNSAFHGEAFVCVSYLSMLFWERNVCWAPTDKHERVYLLDSPSRRVFGRPSRNEAERGRETKAPFIGTGLFMICGGKHRTERTGMKITLTRS